MIGECRSVVAIGEVKEKSAAWGFAPVTIETREKNPVDFAIDDRGCISLIRVRRLKYPRYGIAEIQRDCALEIREPKTLPVPEGISRKFRLHPNIRIVTGKRRVRFP